MNTRQVSIYFYAIAHLSTNMVMQQNHLSTHFIMSLPDISTFVSSLLQVGSYSYDMTKMLFRVSKLTFIQKQSIILDYSIEIRNLREKDKIFLAGALGNYSLAGFEMVRILRCFPTSEAKIPKLSWVNCQPEPNRKLLRKGHWKTTIHFSTNFRFCNYQPNWALVWNLKDSVWTPSVFCLVSLLWKDQQQNSKHWANTITQSLPLKHEF